MAKRNEVRMTESQYKSLRRLIFLWFKVLVRRKYTVFQNILLILSVFANIYLYMTLNNKNILIINKPIDMMQALDLSNYSSVSYKSQNLLQRYNKLYKEYLSDKEKPDSYHYKKSDADAKDWKRYCNVKLRKIINIKTRLVDIEHLLEKNYPSQFDDIQKIIQDTKHEESLSDMSNYYARFVSSEAYDYLLQSSD